MLTCDLCGGNCQSYSELNPLREIYQTKEIKHVCYTCERWTNSQLDDIRAGQAKELKRRLAEKANGVKLGFWQRLTAKLLD